MGTILAAFGAAAAILLSAHSLALRSHEHRARDVAGPTGLAAFVALAALGAMEWGPRYYLFAGWLALLTLATAAAWLRRRSAVRSVRTFKPLRECARGLTLALAAVVAAVPAILFPQGAAPLPATGPYAVASETRTLEDAARVETYGPGTGPRRVTVGLWYPAGDAGTADVELGRRPLVVFSHGSLGVQGSNESLYRELASHGYVVAAIGHTYQALVVTDADGRRHWLAAGFLRDLRSEDAVADPHRSLALYREWLAVRVGDLAFVIDALAGPGAATGEGELRRVAVVGHSLGGSAALAAGRSLEGVAAVVALEAPLLGDITAVVGDEFAFASAPYPVPVLNVYSDDIWSRLTEEPASLPQYGGNLRLLASDDERLSNAHIAGSRHLGLTDLALTSPLLTRLLNGGRQTAASEDVLTELNGLVLGFLAAHLGSAVSGP